MRGYGLGLNLVRLLGHYWENHRIVPEAWKLLGGDVWDGVGRHERRPRIANDFQYRGRRGGTGVVGRGMRATGGPP